MDGKTLRKWRDYMGWSQIQAAAALGIERRAYQDIELDLKPIRPDVEAQALIMEAVRAPRETNDVRRGDWFENIFRYARVKVEAVDQMPKPGRPKNDFYIAALEELLDVVNKNRGTLILSAERIGRLIPRQKISDILSATDAALQARREAEDLHQQKKSLPKAQTNESPKRRFTLKKNPSRG